MSLTSIGKDPNGRIWFKSDRFLVDITEASSFHVEVKQGWFKDKKWLLIATLTKRAAYYRDEPNKRGFVPAITEDKIIGEYTKELSASLALEQVMTLKEIQEIM
jgi:hypothetical protein